MQPEFKLHQDIKAGDEARALLESKLLKECFAKLKQTYLDQLLNTDVTQTAFRDKCWMAARVVDVVQDHLVTVVNNGAVAKSDLAKLAQEAERKKRFGII
ncbi:hypothetical protein AYJ54_00695 [Bradyrhizobium centrolobii]|uniref:Uncharacterized protein n=1 Tax=Bradyrhizobium centrolobii TaxID=1505087 RepID=A0A176YIF8_9BRAD|nr:hypothetical protein [Bradyrhizobium centrolobii]OAF05456.1 hypothetical protein AYJ54_00695 [Bradyrhizobium centrolobii]